MASESDPLDAIVVGAGWAGLASAITWPRPAFVIAYWSGAGSASLAHSALGFLSIEFAQHPNRHAGDQYSGPDPEGALTRDEFVALLEDFAERNRLPIEPDSAVTELAPDQADGVYRLVTVRGTLRAQNVVIANGNLNGPLRPAWAAGLPRSLCQIDTSAYRNPGALHPGAVLVVGSGQSGGQIAEDLAQAGRPVFSPPARSGALGGATVAGTL